MRRRRDSTARKSSRLHRTPQLRSSFEPGKPLEGYYNDLTPEVRAENPIGGSARLRELIADPGVNLTNVVQLGLGAWQLARSDAGWLGVSSTAARWLADQLDERGQLVVRWAMPHTYKIEPPWISAMTQGEAVSLFLRVAAEDSSPEKLFSAAGRAVLPLLGDSPAVAQTPEGPVLQEYPTDPPAHVLNGWIFGLWGLYDFSKMGQRSGLALELVARASRAFDAGIGALGARLPLYDTWGWSRYDLYPHPIVHVASPFYHRLHVELLSATNELAPDPILREFAARWERSASDPVARAAAVSRKVAFRVVRPRRRALRGSSR